MKKALKCRRRLYRDILKRQSPRYINYIYVTSSMLRKLTDYFRNTSDEEIRKTWDELAYLDNVGPTVEEYLKQN